MRLAMLPAVPEAPDLRAPEEDEAVEAAARAPAWTEASLEVSPWVSTVLRGRPVLQRGVEEALREDKVDANA